MSNALARFLGDTPLRVLIRLVILSFVAGIVMSALNFSPRDIYIYFADFVQRLWNMGFELIGHSLEYFLLGAAIVIPVFIVMRLLNFRTPRS